MTRKKDTRQIEIDLGLLIDEGLLQGKELYMMGNLPNAADVNSILKQNGMRLTAIVDNNPAKAGVRDFEGDTYHIIQAGEFLKKDRTGLVLIIFSIRFWREMADQIIRAGFTENEDLFILEALTLDKKIDHINRGCDFCRKLHERYGDDAEIILFFGPIGDNFLFALYLREYLEKNDINNTVFLGTSTSTKVVNMFGLKPYHEVDREMVMSIEFFYMFSKDAQEYIKILQIWEFCFHFNRCRMRFDRRFNFIDTYRHYVFGLDKDSKPCIPSFDTDREELKGLFAEIGLPKGKTVILAPYAYSIEQHPKRIFWLSLSEGLRDKGYSIAMNIDPEREENFIPDAKVISFELKDSVPVLEYAGAFIGMRSGFCDVVSSAKCKKIVLYPETDMSVIDYDRHRNDIEFSSFASMGLADDVIEFEFEDTEDVEYWIKLSERILEVL